MAKGKTNAMRLLDSAKVPYEVLSYESKDGKIDGLSVAEKIGKDPEIVYKTLVVQGSSKEVYVFVIPAGAELSLKRAAAAAGEKKVEMVAVKDIQKLTGYIRGGCSPIGMTKKYQTFIHEACKGKGEIIVSGGKIGMQVSLEPDRLAELTSARFVNITQ
ncbi:Cys-tRNA(Pro) deacylase [Bacillus sp. AGMB 02131]|uniref:Cys-tRNA(Pro)/Cys-tRNA(Cys) deacylase n=1 Tax=Peribacillus faecalis TaxID=2772559 RepID=A0A927CUN0_9BACI|nr:Cys-tRNA(Pro) deacylase [Peribacillus faecalis]MBD3107037.1 Cys-tRNA(Pro) deacylase [Peribacillus faecalis]